MIDIVMEGRILAGGKVVWGSWSRGGGGGGSQLPRLTGCQCTGSQQRVSTAAPRLHARHTHSLVDTPRCLLLLSVAYFRQ